jgi:hypothetical protein
MCEPRRNRGMGCDLASKSRLVVAAAMMSVLLAACGGDSDSPSAAAPTSSGGSGASSGASGASPGGSGASSGGSGASPGGSGASPGGSGASSGGSGASPGGSGASSGGSGALAAVASAKGATTLSWMPPTRNDDGTPLTLTGYRIYWGLTEGYYPHSVTLNNAGLTRYVVEQLTPATWYFVATALSSDGESPPSNVVAMQVR